MLGGNRPRKQKAKLQADSKLRYGLHGRNRTCDLSLRRRTLYPLSYVETP